MSIATAVPVAIDNTPSETPALDRQASGSSFEGWEPRSFSAWRLKTAASQLGLKRAPKAVLGAIAHHANWETGGGVRASMATIATEAGYGLRTAQKHVQDLARLGFIRVRWSIGGLERGGTRGRTHEIVLDIVRIEQRSGMSVAPQSGSPNRAAAAEEQTRPTRYGNSSNQPAGHPRPPSNRKLDDRSVRHALASAGVHEPMLAQLVAIPNLTINHLECLWEAVQKDRTVQNPTKVLIHRLCEHYQIPRGRRGGLSQESANVVRSVEMARQRKGGRGPSW